MTGAELKKHRLSLNLTQKELAVSLCVTLRCVISWETGSRNMPPVAEKLFCLLFNLPFHSPVVPVDDSTPDMFGN